MIAKNIRSADGSLVIAFDQGRIVIDEAKAATRAPASSSVEMFPEPEYDGWDDPYYLEEEAEFERDLDL